MKQELKNEKKTKKQMTWSEFRDAKLEEKQELLAKHVIFLIMNNKLIVKIEEAELF